MRGSRSMSGEGTEERGREGGVACSQSVTEIERESKEGGTGTERRAQSSERGDGALRQRQQEGLRSARKRE